MSEANKARALATEYALSVWNESGLDERDVTNAYLAGYAAGRAAGLREAADVIHAEAESENRWREHYSFKEPNSDFASQSAHTMTVLYELSGEIRALAATEKADKVE